jgi:hypothetical protein
VHDVSKDTLKTQPENFRKNEAGVNWTSYGSEIKFKMWGKKAKTVV